MVRQLRAILLAVTLGFLAACDGDPSGPGMPPAATVNIGPSTLDVVPGQEIQLPLVVRDAKGNAITPEKVRWATEDSTFVTITNTGVIRALRPGRGPVSATVDGVVAVVWVLAYTERLHVWPDTVAFAPGDSRTLAARARPNGAEPATLEHVTWQSSDPAVARVDSAGVVTAVGNGHATITAIAGPARMTSEAYVSTFSKQLRFASTTTAHRHSCGLTADGEAYCWGAGEYGQLAAAPAEPTDRCEHIYRDSHGVNSVTAYRCSAVPVRVASGLRFVALEAGDSDVCGLTAEGAVYCWGGGVGSPLSKSGVPERVPADVPFRSISAGVGGRCALTAEGAAYCWTGSGGTPVAVPGGISFASVSPGGSHSCGVTADGTAYCWGSNASGQLGAPAPDTCASPVSSPCARQPVRVSGNLRFRTVVAGWNATCGLDLDGRAYCWGSAVNGMLGNLLDTGTSPTPSPVAGSLVFTSLRTNGSMMCGLASDGATFCWGERVMRLDGGSSASNPAPTRAHPAFALRSLSVGYSSSCGIAPDGIAHCWGAPAEGLLGNGVFTTSGSPPVRVARQ